MAGSQADKNEKNGKGGAAAVPDETAEMKHKLAVRMAFAGTMIVALLGGLALFDYYSAQPEQETAAPPQFTEPVPVPKKLVTQPVTPPVAVPEAPAPTEVKPAEPEATAAPADKHAPRIDTPPPPEVAAQPSLPRKSATPARAVGAASPAAAPVSAHVTEGKVTASPALPTASERADGGAAAPSAAAEAAPPAPPRLFSGYALQAGVFADPRRAEELQARLVQEGVPATIEARVQVGPFKTRAEAEAARAKLTALGVESVLLPPKSAKR